MYEEDKKCFQMVACDRKLFRITIEHMGQHVVNQESKLNQFILPEPVQINFAHCEDMVEGRDYHQCQES